MFVSIFTFLISIFAVICAVASFSVMIPCTLDLVSSARTRICRILPVFYLGLITGVNLFVIVDRLMGSYAVESLSMVLHDKIVVISGFPSDMVWHILFYVFAATALALISRGMWMLYVGFMSDVSYGDAYMRDAASYVNFGSLLLWSVVHVYNVCV